MLYKSQVTVKLCTFGELSFPVSHTVNRCRHALDQLIAYQYNRSVIEYNSVVEEKYHQYSCSTGTELNQESGGANCCLCRCAHVSINSSHL